MFEVVHENGLVRRFRWKYERRKPTWPKKRKEYTSCLVEYKNPSVGINEWQEEICCYEYCSLTDQFDKAEGRKRALARVLKQFPRLYRSVVWRKYFELFPLVKPQKHACPYCGQIFSEQAENLITRIRRQIPPVTRGKSIAKELMGEEKEDIPAAQIAALVWIGGKHES